MKCKNQNHSKLNVMVRFCCQCGDLVNRSIQINHCSSESHTLSRKRGTRFCSDCGLKLK